MTTPSSLPLSRTNGTRQEHLDDHAALHALFNGQGGKPASLTTSFKGTWSSGTTYAAGDVVLLNSSTYLALASSTGVDPSVAPTAGTVGGQTLANSTTSGATDQYTTFTVNATKTITGLEFREHNTIPVGTVMQLRSSTGTVLASGTSVAAVGGYARATFATPYTVQAGQTYQARIASNASKIAFSGTGVSGFTVTGIVSGIVSSTFASTSTSYSNVFNLIGTDLAWQTLATSNLTSPDGRVWAPRISNNGIITYVPPDLVIGTDDFNRADGPLTAPWLLRQQGSSTVMPVVASQRMKGGSSNSQTVYNSNAAADLYIEATIAVLPSLDLNFTGRDDGTTKYYNFLVAPGGSTTWYSYSGGSAGASGGGGSYTNLGSSSVTFAAGQRIRYSLYGTQQRVTNLTTGATATLVNADITTAGRMGVRFSDTTAAVDDVVVGVTPNANF